MKCKIHTYWMCHTSKETMTVSVSIGMLICFVEITNCCNKTGADTKVEGLEFTQYLCVNINLCFWFVWLVCSFPSKEQKSVKMMSVWEQRANQLRRQNRASCEALYSELDPEERLRLSPALHIRPDMMTHLDRPLVVEPRDGHQHHRHKPEETENATNPPPPPVPHQARRHHRHRDRDRARVREETNDNGDTSKDGRHHVHHSRSKDHNGSWGKEGKSERSRSREGGRKHHHQGSVDDSGGGGVTNEREHRHHHSHRQSRGGKRTVNSGGRGERRSRHKDGRSLNRDGDRNSRGDSGANGERKRHRTHGSRGQSTVVGEESNERETTHCHR